MKDKKSIRFPALTREQVRQIDRIAIEQYQMLGLVLMENAGRGAAEAIDHWTSHLPTTRPQASMAFCILCGKGNNGGDGYVIARHLQLLGHSVRIVSSCEFDELRGDAASNQRIAALSKIPMQVYRGGPISFADDDCLIECLMGTGAIGPTREPITSLIHEANQFSGRRVAIDIPAGLDCDTGMPSDPTLMAHLTCTFVASKIGFATATAASYVGEVQIIPIGVPQKLLEELQMVGEGEPQ